MASLEYHPTTLERMRFFSGMLALARPLNVLISLLSVGLAAFLCNGQPPWARVFLAALAAALIAAAANSINDFFDIDIDAINKPRRPLPSGRVSIFAALIFYGFCNLLALLLATFVNKSSFWIVWFSALLLFLYSARLKGTVLWGNLTVSLVTGLAFLFGGVAVGSWKNALIPAGFAFLMHLGREIIKDLEDVKGDRAGRAQTLPVVHGPRLAGRLVQMIYGLLIVVTLWPFWAGIYGRYYLWLVLLTVDTVLLYAIWQMGLRFDRAALSRLSVILKWDMFMGLIAIYAGRWE
jgi:geranylgeranylglycerol-phosphate geranylgeranyltransferase